MSGTDNATTYPTMADRWREYIQAFPAPASEAATVRDAFYSGAVALWSLLGEVKGPTGGRLTPADNEALLGWTEELKAFVRQSVPARWRDDQDAP